MLYPFLHCIATVQLASLTAPLKCRIRLVIKTNRKFLPIAFNYHHRSSEVPLIFPSTPSNNFSYFFYFSYLYHFLFLVYSSHLFLSFYISFTSHLSFTSYISSISEGISGDSNVKCMKTTSSSDGGLGSPCTANSGCLYGLCDNNVCTAPVLLCPTSTPGIGFYDVTTVLLAVTI